MKAQELRIGNWIEINYENHLGWKVIECTAKMIVLIEKNPYYAAMHRPIPLTPEILEKCGFESNPYQDRYELGDIHFEHCAIRQMIWSEKYPHIKHLHQLQNLIYALTGEELNYTP